MTKIKNYETLIAYKHKSFTQTKIQSFHTQTMIKTLKSKREKDMQNKRQVILQT